MLVIQERHFAPQLSTNVPQQTVTYTRGRDLSGTLEGAGGIGGLLARTENSLLTPGSSLLSPAFYHCDGNGNVTCLLATNGNVLARYLYDPYGNTVSQSGSLADANVYRFSSKEYHAAIGLYYYLYRWYDPSTQRWPNRDPLTEQGHRVLRGACASCYSALPKDGNAYLFCNDAPISKYDPFGLLTKEDCDDAYEADMKKVRAAGLKCTAGVVTWAIGGEIIFGGIGIVGGGLIGALPGAGLGLIIGTGVDVVVDLCHYLHCKKEVDEMQKAADEAYEDCLKKVDQ
jgi:RHS repeat-associated protein